MRITALAAALLGGLLAAPLAQAAQSSLQPAKAVITRHSGRFNGKTVSYRAVVAPIVVDDASGKPGARIVSISYIASGVSDAAKRPVLFAFNGGPIFPSDLVQMGLLGPKRVAIPKDLHADPASFKIVDNPDTVLDVADIVFFDPAGTGFSRVMPGVDPKSYYSVTADAQQTAQFIIAWCREHHRMNAPVYLLGESYGTMRAAMTANMLQKAKVSVNLRGVILAGQALNIIEWSQRPANIISYVASLPTLAAVAWSHGKADMQGRSFDQFIADAFHYARTDYLTALYQGNTLDPATRKAVAAKLAAFTGIPASYYLVHHLEITKQQYRHELLKDEHEVLGMADGRYAGPLAPNGHRTDPSGVIEKAYEHGFKAYLHDVLKVPDSAHYRYGDPLKAGEHWTYDGGVRVGSPFADWPYPKLLSQVFAVNRDFRVMVTNGYEDMETTIGGAQYLVDRAGWPAKRVSLHFYQGGHMAYSDPDSLKAMSHDIRDFLRPGG